MDRKDFLQACTCDTLADILCARGPFGQLQDLLAAARDIWWQQVPVTGWLQAFTAHPRLGRVEASQTTSPEFLQLSKAEQSGVAEAPSSILQALTACQQQYEAKFGHVFLLCASGRSAEDMLISVKGRYGNAPGKELLIAAGEQMKITELRLKQLWEGKQPAAARRTGSQEVEHAGDGRSPITSHVLDIARGCPAQGVQILLEREADGSQACAWSQLGCGFTNQDGRVPYLLPASHRLQPGCYRVTFSMEEYMRRCRDQHPDFFQTPCFYPQAEVRFTVAEHQTAQHFHIPLTWSPYGYTTYRGS
ncbi:hypothetical protein WJX74_000807 [Apatococcus lobatus]|uniref:Hydroxyisourate hydrolase n=1 Tax=Apatococcus lobatus TaxID=904363 RepID=A0AAW1QCZ1_9CHLO